MKDNNIYEEMYKVHNEWFMDKTVNTIKEYLIHWGDEAPYDEKCLRFKMLQLLCNMIVNHEIK